MRLWIWFWRRQANRWSEEYLQYAPCRGCKGEGGCGPELAAEACIQLAIAKAQYNIAAKKLQGLGVDRQLIGEDDG